MSKVYISILQWNMGDSPHATKKRGNYQERAQILTDLLTGHNPTFVTLQEADRVVLSYANLRSYELYNGPPGLVTLVTKDKYKTNENLTRNDRYQLLALDSISRTDKGIKIINLHLPALHKSDDQKREFLRKDMPFINAWRTKHESLYEILSGDFNLPPYDIVIMEETGVFANRDLKHTIKTTSTFGFGRALYNTSWQVFGGTCGALGTYYYKTLPHGPWHIPDQILIDPKLIGDALVQVKILTDANGQSLATKKVFAPNRDNSSDHFPVLVSIYAKS
ncbi:exonuclease/endonuclease/phosphatase family protein [Spirosoma pollinicola]|uniref:Endonuclease/exonuclease/phosphatase n=1 Tax=Spirosoma pollinicola TaxID=2057025 RepID=A0A2K8Z2I3_9BACT|nr:hypothetical protein [Spirosoma pollinicola]AUD04034.1 hypothetical protein CWM47_20700 [Spirosoma pollinicola]